MYQRDIYSTVKPVHENRQPKSGSTVHALQRKACVAMVA